MLRLELFEKQILDARVKIRRQKPIVGVSRSENRSNFDRQRVDVFLCNRGFRFETGPKSGLKIAWNDWIFANCEAFWFQGYI